MKRVILVVTMWGCSLMSSAADLTTLMGLYKGQCVVQEWDSEGTLVAPAEVYPEEYFLFFKPSLKAESDVRKREFIGFMILDRTASGKSLKGLSHEELVDYFAKDGSAYQGTANYHDAIGELVGSSYQTRFRYMPAVSPTGYSPVGFESTMNLSASPFSVRETFTFKLPTEGRSQSDCGKFERILSCSELPMFMTGGCK